MRKIELSFLLFCISSREYLSSRNCHIYHNREINSGKIEDRIPFVEEAADPNSTYCGY